MVSREPDCSPAAIRLQNSSSKYSFGCALTAAAKLLPPETSLAMFLMSAFIAGLSTPPATISKDCTRGTPAFIMVASWRVNKAMSAGPIFLPPSENIGFDRFLTLPALMPCFRSWAFTKLTLRPLVSPATFLPALSVPFQSKIRSSAMGVVPSDHW